jgi:hypothetical protein
VAGGKDRSCTLVFMFSETALEEPFTAVEGFLWDLIGRPRRTVAEREVVDYVYLLFCSVDAALEKPSVTPRRERSGGLERAGSRDPGRGGNRGS